MRMPPCPGGRPGSPATRNRAAFTLLEVVLAVSIAIGILVVALYFYGQATDLRSRLLEETDRLAATRLCLDRWTSDLRQAFAQPQVGFTGTASSMRFVRSGLPWKAAAGPVDWTQPRLQESDLRIVTYRAVVASEGTNEVVAGIARSETPLLDKPPVVTLSTNAPTAAPAAGSAGASAAGSATGSVAGRPGSPAGPRAPAPWVDVIHFVQLNYWDGAGWAEHWDSVVPPAAVEIVIGWDPLPTGSDPLDYPGETFRRVVFIPASRGAEDPFDLFTTLEAPGRRPLPGTALLAAVPSSNR